MLPLFFFQMKEGWAGLSAQLMWLSLVQPPCIKKKNNWADYQPKNKTGLGLELESNLPSLQAKGVFGKLTLIHFS